MNYKHLNATQKRVKKSTYFNLDEFNLIKSIADQFDKGFSDFIRDVVLKVCERHNNGHRKELNEFFKVNFP